MSKKNRGRKSMSRKSTGRSMGRSMSRKSTGRSMSKKSMGRSMSRGKSVSVSRKKNTELGRQQKSHKRTSAPKMQTKKTVQQRTKMMPKRCSAPSRMSTTGRLHSRAPASDTVTNFIEGEISNSEDDFF
ncbi:hypothetical protein FKM82_013545 [Ascaphus truei]